MQEKITFDIFIRKAAIVLLVVLVLLTMNYLSGVLLPFFVAWLFAYLLYPIVRFVQYRMKVKIRALAIVVTLVFVIGLISLMLWFIIPPMIEQFQKLGDVMSRWVQQTTHTNNVSALILDYEFLTTNWVRIFPEKHRSFWHLLMKDVERELNKYIRGQGLVALCMGIMFCIGFTIMDFPMAIGLGILIGIMDLVPYLHTFALIPTAFLAMLKAADTGQNFWAVFGLAV